MTYQRKGRSHAEKREAVVAAWRAGKGKLSRHDVAAQAGVCVAFAISFKPQDVNEARLRMGRPPGSGTGNSADHVTARAVLDAVDGGYVGTQRGLADMTGVSGERVRQILEAHRPQWILDRRAERAAKEPKVKPYKPRRKGPKPGSKVEAVVNAYKSGVATSRECASIAGCSQPVAYTALMRHTDYVGKVGKPGRK